MSLRSSLPVKTLVEVSIIFLITIFSSSCTVHSANDSQLDPAAQATRSILLATRMAENLQATNQVRFAHVTATAEAFQNDLAATRSWTEIISDSFDEDEGIWITGESEDSLATMNWTISDGKYNWSASANSGFVWWMVPESDEVSSAYAAVEVSISEGPEDAEMGLVFRSDGLSSYYLFMIDNQGRYYASIHSPEGWETLLDWTPSGDILLHQTNHLGVLAERDQFLLFINQKYQGIIQDDRLDSGQAGLAIGLSTSGDAANWMFDNFEIRAPQSEPIEARIP
jgi:hypothetical protein